MLCPFQFFVHSFRDYTTASLKENYTRFHLSLLYFDACALNQEDLILEGKLYSRSGYIGGPSQFFTSETPITGGGGARFMEYPLVEEGVVLSKALHNYMLENHFVLYISSYEMNEVD